MVLSMSMCHDSLTCEKVSAKFKNDIGLKYDRLKWRRRRGRLEPSLEILFNIPKEPMKLVRPDMWWKESRLALLLYGLGLVF